MGHNVMPFGLIEAALIFGIVLALAVYDLWKTRAEMKSDRKADSAD